jgi:hypothetical protein
MMTTKMTMEITEEARIQRPGRRGRRKSANMQSSWRRRIRRMTTLYFNKGNTMSSQSLVLLQSTPSSTNI